MEPCRVFLEILYNHGAGDPPEPGFGFWKVGTGAKQGEAARLGAVCVPACTRTFPQI